MGTMMFPGVINLIPLYKLVDIFGWIDTPLAMIIPGAGGVFNIFLIRQFMMGIPKDYDESARMDGASEWHIYSKILIPLSRPVLTLVGLFVFTGSWNDFLWPTIVFNDRNKLPLTAGLQLLQGIYDIEIAHLMASTIVAILPTTLIFFLAQRYFLTGLNLSSGIKG
jgi:multiple sugar transport system permease protein